MILLDTHVLLWLDLGRVELGPACRRRADEAMRVGDLFVSAISFWEIARLAQRARRHQLRADFDGARHDQPVGRIPMQFLELGRRDADPAIDRHFAEPAAEQVSSLRVRRQRQDHTADRRILAWPGDLLRLDARE